jgi:hypothetical protein
VSELCGGGALWIDCTARQKVDKKPGWLLARVWATMDNTLTAVSSAMAHPTLHEPSATAQSRLYRFDMRAFHVAVDAARQIRGLSWAELAAEINRPFEGTTSIPIHPATLRGMLAKRSVTSAVVLQALAWLGRTPESFLTGPSSLPETPLPDSGPGALCASTPERYTPP